ncbi:DUF1203 domain-containing protein [Streptomyces sp. NPDC030392]|uniref:DUF1203 domain-containing protein n=1 Tax=Streptomyces sp. NPDC030392 TaxID=3155468 RepID=UPI0033FECF9A
MRILLGAQNCGFGPASELVAVSRLLRGHRRVFVGDGIAAAFARRNPDAFDTVRATDGMTPDAADRAAGELVAQCDLVVSVMDADLVVRAVVAGRPVVMVDSLFGFWRVRQPLGRLHERCAALPRSSLTAARRHLDGLTPHERVVAAHLLATHRGYPFAETGAPRVLRRYSGEGRITGGALVRLPDDPDQAQAAVEQALHGAFADPGVALVHVRAVEYGCFQYEVRRP